VAEPIAQTVGVRVVPLADPWAHRRIVICFRDEDSLSPAARMLVEHLEAASRAAPPPAAAAAPGRRRQR